jgi:hypothetical protein
MELAQPAQSTFDTPALPQLQAKPKARRITAFLRKWHILKPEPTLGQRRESLMQKAIKCASSMHMDDALKHLTEAIHSCGISSEALLLKGLVYLDKGELQLAAQAFRASIETLKAVKEPENMVLGLFVEEYMRMRHAHPAPNVPPISYVPVQNAFRAATIGSFGQADKDIAYTLNYASGGLQEPVSTDGQ